MDLKEGLQKAGEFSKKLWYLLWKDNSFKGWIFSVVFIFVFIKFIFFPFLSFATGTQLPLAIVESCSMYHQGDIISDFNAWFERHNEKYNTYTITKTDFGEFHFKNGFNKGDILFIVGAKAEKLEVGDIIIFDAGQRNPVIHRIINITENSNGLIFSTLGDNNNGQLASEKLIYESQLVGKASFRLAPMLGWVKLIFYDKNNPQSERGFCDER
ncbi:MAG: signal peptidase I [Candidatus Pacearchaeota archaeon]